MYAPGDQVATNGGGRLGILAISGVTAKQAYEWLTGVRWKLSSDDVKAIPEIVVDDYGVVIYTTEYGMNLVLTSSAVLVWFTTSQLCRFEGAKSHHQRTPQCFIKSTAPQ